MTVQQDETKAETKPLATVTSGQPHLAKQDLSNLDITKLTPLSPGQKMEDKATGMELGRPI
jgi:hypothetical protein